MARKKQQLQSQLPTTTQPNTGSFSTSDFINTGSKEYAIYTAQNRAIPSSCDGLKDGQRKMLWLMRNKAEKVKTISLAGLSIQEGLFLHGDASAAETISRLAAPFLNNLPLLDGEGAFGTRVGPDSWGAPRYTYVKRSKVADALLYNDLDIVPLKPNYDGSVMEPSNFLPLIPIVLLNGVSGIAVGWSTDILPHSLKSIVEATIAAIDGKTIPKLQPSFDYLDIQTTELATNAYEFTGRVKIESNTVIRVVELPPDLSLEKFKVRLNTMEEEDAIHSYIDSSAKAINVEIRFKRGTIDGWSEQDVIDFLKLKNKATQRLVVLDFNNARIRQYDSAEDLIKSFVEWRVGWYNVRYQKMIDDLMKDLNFSLAVKACVENDLPQKLPTSKNKSEIENMVKSFTNGIDLDDSQIDKIVSFPSYRWALDSIKKVIDEILVLGEKIVDLEELLKNPKKIRDVYKKEVQSLLKLS